MTKINLKKTRWFKYYYEIQKEYDLSAQQTMIYGYIYNHCQNINDNGYIGYSDERMAKDLNISYERFKKELSCLKRKNLIIVKNPGKRTKKTNESRMIYINTAIFLEEEQVSLTDIELDNAKKKIEKLENQIKELTAELSKAKKFGNAFTLRIEHSKVIPDNQIEDMHRILASVYEAMANEYTFKQIMSHIDYVINQIKRRNVSKPIAYILNSAQHFKSNEQKEEEIDKTFHSLPKVDLNKLENEQEFYHQEVLELDIDDDDPFA